MAKLTAVGFALLTLLGTSATAEASSLVCESLFSRVKTNDGVTRSVYRTSEGDLGLVELHGPIRAKQVVFLLSGLDRGRDQWNSARSQLSRNLPRVLFVQVDLVGQGTSLLGTKRATRKISPDTQVEILENLIEQYGWRNKDITVAGHSYGAAIATHFAARKTTPVKNLVLIAPYVDALETTYNPGIKMLRSYAHAMGFKSTYDAQVMLGTQIGTMMSWPFQSIVRGSSARAANVVSMTEGLRDFEMNATLANLDRTNVTLLRSTFDELIPMPAHQELWRAVPRGLRRAFREIWSVHDSVTIEPMKIAAEIEPLLAIAP